MNFIQIGGHNANDHVFEKVKDFDIELGVIIEPLSWLNNQIRDCYKDKSNIFIENIAIMPDDRQNSVDFYHYDNDSNFEVSSVNKDHVVKVGLLDDNQIKTIKDPTSTLENILEKYSIKELDWLFIDAEGLDIPILMSIDYSDYNIKNIIFEHYHAGGPNVSKGSAYDNACSYLRAFGYSIKDYDSLNTLATYDN